MEHKNNSIARWVQLILFQTDTYPTQAEFIFKFSPKGSNKWKVEIGHNNGKILHLTKAYDVFWLNESPSVPPVADTKDAEDVDEYPTYEQSGGSKPWDKMSELEKAYYKIRKLHNALIVNKNTIQSLRNAEKLAKEYIKQITISSASVDPKRDRERYLGFLAGYSAKSNQGEKEDGPDG